MMNNFESTRSDDRGDGILGCERRSCEIDVLGDPQRDSAPLHRLEGSSSFSSNLSARVLFDRACFYRKYIQSSAWRSSVARLGEMEASGNRCRLCDAPNTADSKLEVHHRTYARLGCELQRDLTALCADCHRGVTSMLRERRYAATIPLSTDVVLSGLRQRLLDPTREEAE